MLSAKGLLLQPGNIPQPKFQRMQLNCEKWQATQIQDNIYARPFLNGQWVITERGLKRFFYDIVTKGGEGGSLKYVIPKILNQNAPVGIALVNCPTR